MKRDRKYILHTSREIAKARAELAVSSDRLDCSPNDLEELRSELTGVLSKYMQLDDTIFEIRMDIVYGRSRGIQDVKTIQIK